jgi:hypothetical protein
MTENGVHDCARVCDQKGCNDKILRRVVHMVVEDCVHILSLSIHDLCGYGEGACEEEQENY